MISATISFLFFLQRVLEKEVYIFRLSEANTNVSEKPRYFKLYDARNDLEMDSLFPRDYDKVVHRLAEDDDYYAKYFRYILRIPTKISLFRRERIIIFRLNEKTAFFSTFSIGIIITTQLETTTLAEP